MILSLVIENLKHRPVRTALSTVAIGLQVTMVLTLVGVSRGMLEESSKRVRGTQADILIKDGGSAVIGFSSDMKAKYLPFIQTFPGVAYATGALIQPVGMLDSITGIDYEAFNRMSGGFHFLNGGPFQGPDDLIVDEIYARSKGLKAGDQVQGILNRNWRVAGVVESGKLSRVFVQLDVLKDLMSKSDKLTAIYVKASDPTKLDALVAAMREKMPENKVITVEEFVSLVSVNNIPMLRTFIRVVIGLGVLIGFLVVFLSMYTAVLERTREIGILKSLGASPFYIVSILLAETAVLAVLGSVIGVLFTYGTKWIMHTFVPEMVQVTTPDWWPIAAGIAITGSLVGAVYPGLKAARQDAIEALAYD